MEADHEIYLCGMVEFIAEYRVYVHEHEVVGVKNYFGDWYSAPAERVVTDMVEAYKPSAPIAYGLDVGILKDNQYHMALVEINDGICLGNYGLDTIHYAEMIASRWLELTTKGKV